MPIIARTANIAPDARQACMDAGMDDFLAKPVNTGMLSGVLESYVKPS
jgi:CheY-like chemotaxis protein